MSKSISPLPIRQSFHLPLIIHFKGSTHIAALVDSGAVVNLIHHDLVTELKIFTSPCTPSINVTAFDNEPIGTGITQQTIALTIRIGIFQRDDLAVRPIFTKESYHPGSLLVNHTRSQYFLGTSWPPSVVKLLSSKMLPIHDNSAMSLHKHRKSWHSSSHPASRGICWIHWIQCSPKPKQPSSSLTFLGIGSSNSCSIWPLLKAIWPLFSFIISRDPGYGEICRAGISLRLHTSFHVSGCSRILLCQKKGWRPQTLHWLPQP